MSLDAAGQTGTIITKPLIFEGDKLLLNVAAKGSVRVGILNLPGRAFSGFAVKDCDPITTDSVRQVMTWKGNSDVGKLAGKAVRLRIEMQNAKLFAFEFE